MNCKIIQDLIPLYIDKCCSGETEKAVKEHIGKCAECYSVYKSMTASVNTEKAETKAVKIRKINDWKASILQSAMLFASFLIITIGVAIEASIPHGFDNGFAAFNIVIPATGFMLSLANWYFIKFYKSKKSFSNFSCFITFLITLCAGIWCGFHYEFTIFDFWEIFADSDIVDFLESVFMVTLRYAIGILFTVTLCLVSKLSSNAYATMLGKE
jgi:hypothetical protein